MKRYTVDLIINTSHSVDDIGYQSSNAYKISDSEKQCEKIVLSIDEENDFPEKEIKKHFEKEAQIASLAVAKNERNPTDGCPYFTVNWESLNVERISNSITNHGNGIMSSEENIEISEYFSMKATRTIQMDEIKKYLNNSKKL
jgi:hypothetical protein